jgi:hypothetical protein
MYSDSLLGCGAGLGHTIESIRIYHEMCVEY